MSLRLVSLTCICLVNGVPYGRGHAPTRIRAKEAAASQALRALEAIHARKNEPPPEVWRTEDIDNMTGEHVHYPG